MSRKILNRIFAALAVLLGGIMTAGAQESYGGYSPYTIFGVGDLALQGSTYNKSMGGVGIAGRNNRYLNIMNPAAVTARDSLSFMSSFSLNVNNRIYRQGDAISANNIFNINDVVISFPIQRASAMMLGIVPYSDVGYEFSEIYTDPELVGSVGEAGSAATGIGSVYKAFAAAGVTFLKRISIGAEMDYYFGKLTKSYVTQFGDSSYQSISNNNVLQLNGIGGKFGLQYEQPFGNDVSLVLGATYSTGAKLRGYFEDSRYSEGTASIDTISFRIDTLGVTRHASLASEIGVGISLKKTNKWMFEADYTRSDWRNSGMENISGYNLSSIPFSTSVSEAYRVGFEYIPNINDIRYYFNRVAYRVGAYYKKEYFALSGHQIASMGITLGATLPVFRWYNGLSFGVEFGQRASLTGNLTRERYVNFSIGINIFDIWFQKPQYE